MFRILIVSASIALLGTCGQSPAPETPIDAQAAPKPEEPLSNRQPAQLIEHEAFASEHVKPRNLTIWLPAGYRPREGDGYPVIYAQDGQNLFPPELSYGGVDWALDDAAEAIMANSNAGQASIVGIWNTDERWQEYAPQKVIESLPGDTASEWLGPVLPDLKGDAYLHFITEELKPFIDETYNTSSMSDNTFIMGSSMGGLISLYAIAEYPDIFSRAAAVSIHCPRTEPDGAIA